MSPFILLFLGLLLILIEFYIPGAVMGITGTFMIMASFFYFVLEGHTWIEILGFILLTILLVVGVIKFALWHIKKAGSQNSLYLQVDQEGYHAAQIDKNLIGKKGSVLSDLKPSGYILIEGKKYQAISQGEYISEGGEIIVVSGQGAYLIVKSHNKVGGL